MKSYVQRNGDVYEFLTDDEKDVEDEIKNTDIDEQAVSQLLKELFFDEIIRDNRIKYLENKQDYDFTSKIDGAVLGRERELEIEIITENHPDYENTSNLQAQTTAGTGMKMLLDSNAIFMKDLRMYLRTNKYVKQHQSASNRAEVKRILQDKGQQNAERRRNLIMMANQLLGASTVFMNGTKHEIGASTDGKTKVVKAFQDLIKTVHANLRMLGGVAFSEDTIKTVIISQQDDLFKGDDETISEAEHEVLNLIDRRKKQSDRTSLSDLKDHFTRRPYGWYPNAIWTVTAKLYKRGKIELKQDSNLLEDDAALNAFLNSSKHGNTLLEQQTEIDPKHIKQLKQLYADAFDESYPSKEPKELALAFKERLKVMFVEVNQLLARKSEYSFLNGLQELSDKLARLTQKEYSYYLINIKDFEDDLLDAKEDLLDPIKRFMNGNQKTVYDDIKTLVNGNTANIGYIEGDEFDTLQILMKSETPYKGDGVQLAKAAKDGLGKKVIDAINKEKEHFNTKIDAIEADIKNSEEFGKINTSQQDDIQDVIKALHDKIKSERFIGNIKDEVRKLEDYFYSEQMNKMVDWLAPKDQEGEIEEPKAKYIKRTNIRINFEQRELKTEEDVAAYLEVLKKAYMERINQNLKITL